MRRRKPVVNLMKAIPGQALLAAVGKATSGPSQASWDARMLAAIMLVSIDCSEEQAREALQPSYDFYGSTEFGSSDEGTEGEASFARGTVDMAARRLQDARSHAEWEERANAMLEKRKSKLRVVKGGAQ